MGILPNPQMDEDLLPFTTWPSFPDSLADNLTDSLTEDNVPDFNEPSLSFEFVSRSRKKVLMVNKKPVITSIRRDKSNTIRNVMDEKKVDSRRRYINLLVTNGTPSIRYSFDLYDSFGSILIEREMSFTIERGNLIRICLTNLEPSFYKRQEDVDLTLYCYEKRVLISCTPFVISWWKADRGKPKGLS